MPVIILFSVKYVCCKSILKFIRITFTCCRYCESFCIKQFCFIKRTECKSVDCRVNCHLRFKYLILSIFALQQFCSRIYCCCKLSITFFCVSRCLICTSFRKCFVQSRNINADFNIDIICCFYFFVSCCCQSDRTLSFLHRSRFVDRMFVLICQRNDLHNVLIRTFYCEEFVCCIVRLNDCINVCQCSDKHLFCIVRICCDSCNRCVRKI